MNCREKEKETNKEKGGRWKKKGGKQRWKTKIFEKEVSQ